MVQGVHASAAAVRSLGGDHMIVTAGNTVAGETYKMTRRRVVRKLSAMASAAEAEGVTLCLEPLNIFVDHPDYWLTTMAQAADIVEEIDSPNIRSSTTSTTNRSPKATSLPIWRNTRP